MVLAVVVPLLKSAINQAVAAGTTVVVAAGNSNANANNFNPGNCNNVINVAATNKSGERAWYSNYGSSVDVAGPGGETNGDPSLGVLSTIDTGKRTPAGDGYGFLSRHFNGNPTCCRCCSHSLWTKT